ncbi:MAG: substrate-binding domain-containing protein [Saprospiraceae bacterium]|nr:substrate-binding domain-containing protein [Saprospiraceae bacterium]
MKFKLERILSLSGIFLIIFIGMSCNPANHKETKPTEGRMSVYVDKSLADLIIQQKQIFERNYPNAIVDLEFSSEQELKRKFMKDSVGIVIGYLKLNKEEKDFLFKNQQSQPREFVVAVSAIAFIASPEAEDSSLTYESIIDLIRGKSDHAASFNSFVIEDNQSGIGPALLQLAGVEIAPAKMYALPSKEKIIEQINNNPRILAAVDWTEWSDSDRTDLSKTLNGLKVLKVSRPKDSLNAGYFGPYQYHLAEGFYPFTREITILTRTGKTDVGLGFASFIGGEIGQKIILKSGLLPKFQSDRWVELVPISGLKLEK